MQSPSNKINRSFASLFPSIHKIKEQKTPQNNDYELNNQGCKCQMCQKIIINENMKMFSEEITDLESEQFTKDSTKEYYIELIQQIFTHWKFKRSLRFCLPEVCLYKDAHPYALIEKKKQNISISINKSKSRLHFFQIQNFFLTGYMTHSPTKKNRQSKNQAVSKPYMNECIIFAKYDGNFYRMLTYQQIETIFRSKNRHMKDGLMYLQTIVGGDQFKYRTVIVKLDDIQNNLDMKALFERAKAEVKIICGQIKLTDVEYFQENEEIQFENDLKNFDINRYLLYLSYKILLVQSKLKQQIVKHAIFKYSVIDKKVFLFDFRVKQYGSNLKYWTSNVLQALQVKLKKTMSLMELENSSKTDKFNLFTNQLSFKARQLSQWLEASTQEEWQQMKTIRKRLERLQEQKKSLQNSKKQQQLRKSFKLRNIKNNKTKQKDLSNDLSFHP